MRILVTGGAGFIGSALCRFLIKETDTIVLNFDKLTYAANLRSLDLISANPRYTFIKADICDYEGVRQAFDDFEPDAVINLAAESHVDRSITGSSPFIQTNICGTYSLLEVARGYWEKLPRSRREAFRFLHVSTDEVYGSLDDHGLFCEYTPYNPSSPYSASKAASDHLVLAWHRTYGLPTLISNCSNNYGPYHFPEKLIPLTIVNAIEGKPLPVYGNGSNVRDWLYVEDHAQALHLVVRNGRIAEKYNIGGRNERTNLALVKQICMILDRLVPEDAPHERLITFVPDRPGHDHRYAIDPSKIEGELGWCTKETLDTGLGKTVAWYLANRNWWEPLRKTVYSGERLGLRSAPPVNVSA